MNTDSTSMDDITAVPGLLQSIADMEHGQGAPTVTRALAEVSIHARSRPLQEPDMTSIDAAALALIGSRHRRLLAALLREIAGRADEEDAARLVPRAPGEPLVAWACRCRTPLAPPEFVDAEATRVLRLAEGQLAKAAAAGESPLTLPDARYPALLAAIPDPPPVLWLRGQLDALTSPGIALVGSRAATPYGLAMARQLAGQLATAGATIVSGLARGIDSAAHVAALAAGGRTVGVLGCGLDRVYPPEHRDLVLEMQDRGAVVSEFPIGVPPLAHHFPLRNRIISGLSLAVVVVEAPEKSGALITAAAALEQGRDVMVVPGPAAGGRNRGGHLLIRDGAKVVESADDILTEAGAGWSRPDAATVATRNPNIGQLPDMTDFSIDDVTERTGEPPGVVLARLLELELAGQIQRVGGGRFARVLT
jgi:DNA processing protein